MKKLILSLVAFFGVSMPASALELNLGTDLVDMFGFTGNVTAEVRSENIGVTATWAELNKDRIFYHRVARGRKLMLHYYFGSPKESQWYLGGGAGSLRGYEKDFDLFGNLDTIKDISGSAALGAIGYQVRSGDFRYDFGYVYASYDYRGVLGGARYAMSYSF